MALINMKMAPPKKGSDTLIADSEYDDSGPAYPWGLQLSLCEDDLAKLGITELPPLGTKLMLTAMVEVTDTSESKRLKPDGSPDESTNLGLQITDMSLDSSDSAESREDNIASKLYG